MTSESIPLPRRSEWWRGKGQKVIAVVVWGLLLGSYGYYIWRNGLTAERALEELRALFDTSYGPLLYLLSFLIRPLLFFSAGILCILGGLIFGAGSTANLLLALGYASVGVVASALISFGIGRFFGQGVIINGNSGSHHLVQQYATRLRHNGFLTVLTLRLLLLPFDIVNYLAALVGVNWKAYTLATAIGILPSTLAFVSFGAALDIRQLAAGQKPQIDIKMIILAVGLFALSLGISRWYKRRDV